MGKEEKEEKEEKDEKEEKEEVRSNALLYTYRLRGWRRRSEYMREATNSAQEKFIKKTFLLVPPPQKKLCLKTDGFWKIVCLGLSCKYLHFAF